MPIVCTVAANIDSILKLEVPVIVQIGKRTMPVEEVVSIAPGAIIELPKSAADDLEILVNNKLVGTGTAVKVGENFGVRVSYIGDVAQRIAAMGGGREPRPESVPDADRGDEADEEPSAGAGAQDAEAADAAAAPSGEER